MSITNVPRADDTMTNHDVEPSTSDLPEFRRLAALDVGSNSIRLIVVELSTDAGYRTLDDEKVIARLGQGLASTGRMDPERIEFAVAAIERLKKIADGFGVTRLRAVATAAIREAANGPDLVRLARERAGVDLEVISADKEARLSLRSIQASFDLDNTNALITDIGGGSTELLSSIGGIVDNVQTMRLGAVRLTEMFGPCETPAQFERMRAHVMRTLRSDAHEPSVPVQMMYGTGGTFTALAALNMMRRESSQSTGSVLPFAIRGYELQRSDVRHILDWLTKLNVRQRAALPGLSPDRAEIIVAGVLIAERVMRRFDVNRLRVHDGGIRDGLIHVMIDELLGRVPEEGRPRTPIDRLAEARRFAARCHDEESSGEHVASLAASIFDQLALLFEQSHPGVFTSENRELLQAAALLRDVGYLINYAKHHKHSYHLIVHSDLRGFTAREVAMIANTARYHRRSEPKRKHREFTKLEPDDRRIVEVLSAILRVADGLDRTHTQVIRSVEISRDAESGDLRMLVHADSFPEVDIWGAERRKELLQRVFETQIVTRWADDPERIPTSIEDKKPDR